jgi:uncharacterized delta-60 repeat protein
MRFLFTFILFLTIGWQLKAQDGTLDQTFSSDGITTYSPSGNFIDNGNGMAVQADGKTLTCGVIQPTNVFSFDLLVCRFNTDGSVDQTFADNGYFTMAQSGGSDYGNDIKVLPDGTILVAGAMSITAANTAFQVIKLTSDGVLDASFGTNGVTTIDMDSGEDYVHSLLVADNGKIYLCGETGVPNLIYFRIGMARLNSDGTLDLTFATNGKAITAQPSSNVSTSVTNFEFSADQTAIYGSGYRGVNSDQFCLLTKLNADDGSLDASFGTDGYVFTATVPGSYDALVVHSDGHIYTFGYKVASATQPGLVGKFTSSGTLVTTFGDMGHLHVFQGMLSYFYDAIEVEDGDMIACGTSSPGGFPANSSFLTARITSTGTVNSNWGADGTEETQMSASTDAASAIGRQPDGKIVIVGTSNFGGGNDVGVARFILGPIIIQPLNANATATAALCYGEPTGSFTINPFYGYPPYTVSINGGAATATLTYTAQTAGSYSYIVYDSQGGQFAGSVTVGSAAELTLTATVTGNDVTLVAAGGTPPYQYDVNGGMIQTNPTYTNMAFGDYDFTVSDSGGCSATESASIINATSDFTNNTAMFWAYPTLSTGSVRLKTTIDLSGEPIRLFGMDGRQQELGAWPTLADHLDVDLGDLPNGVYQIGCGRFATRVVVQH